MKKLFYIRSVPKGPHEKGTYFVNVTEHGYLLAEDDEQAETLARELYEIPRGHKLERFTIKRDNASLHRVQEREEEMVAERKRLNQNLKVMREWIRSMT